MRASNVYHRQVCEWARELGLLYVEEYMVGPYSADIYLPELFLVVEIDGPYHALSKRRDTERDAYLAEHGLRVLRIRVGVPKEDVLRRLGEYVGGMAWR